MRPSAILLSLRNPKGKWSKTDHALAAALTIIDSETAPSGYHWSIAGTEDSNVQWRTEKVTDYAERRKAQDEKKRSEKKNHKPEDDAGVYLRPVPYLDNKELGWPSREEWLEGVKQRREALDS